MFPIACDTTEKVEVTVTPMTEADGGGEPAAVDGPLRIRVTSGDGSFTQDPAAPLTFFAVSGDKEGVTVFNVAVDADRGAGVELIETTVELTVTAAKAKFLGFTSAAPVKK